MRTSKFIKYCCYSSSSCFVNGAEPGDREQSKYAKFKNTLTLGCGPATGSSCCSRLRIGFLDFLVWFCAGVFVDKNWKICLIWWNLNQSGWLAQPRELLAQLPRSVMLFARLLWRLLSCCSRSAFLGGLEKWPGHVFCRMKLLDWTE